jgi:alkanesulfonate monooxygenase SsuD/methylene tetrahydromethanopterin reductase-like flavin-dependent oxidoreductase (luciferase family)
MRVSSVLPYQDWAQCGPAAQAAEADGIDVIQCPELANDPFIPLAFAALGSTAIELASSVAIAFPRSPMIVANLAWDLARHSGGRFVLGLGSQVRAHNERRFSVPWVAPARIRPCAPSGARGKPAPSWTTRASTTPSR